MMNSLKEKVLEVNPFCTCGKFGVVRPVARFEIRHRSSKERIMHELPLNFTLCQQHKDIPLTEHVFSTAVQESIARQMKEHDWITNFTKREVVVQPFNIMG